MMHFAGVTRSITYWHARNRTASDRDRQAQDSDNSEAAGGKLRRSKGRVDVPSHSVTAMSRRLAGGWQTINSLLHRQLERLRVRLRLWPYQKWDRDRDTVTRTVTVTV
eukprot:683290-Rhodomonas_salina.1